MGYLKSFIFWIATKTIVKLTTENRFKTVEKKTFIKTFLNEWLPINVT